MGTVIKYIGAIIFGGGLCAGGYKVATKAKDYEKTVNCLKTVNKYINSPEFAQMCSDLNMITNKEEK